MWIKAPAHCIFSKEYDSMANLVASTYLFLWKLCLTFIEAMAKLGHFMLLQCFDFQEKDKNGEDTSCWNTNKWTEVIPWNPWTIHKCNMPAGMYRWLENGHCSLILLVQFIMQRYDCLANAKQAIIALILLKKVP